MLSARQLVLVLGCCALLTMPVLLRADESKPRLIVLTDIGGDPDDTQSLVRLLVNANRFEIEGLIASASGRPGEVKPHLIREAVERYGQVRGNLALHADGFPTSEQLARCIKSGNPRRGLANIGEGHDSEGSRWIISVVDRPDARRVNIAIWGGQTDLAQALWRVRTDRGISGVEQFSERIRIYDIADQDGIASWFDEQVPDLFYVLNKAAEGQDRREAVFRGMYLGGDISSTSRDWIDQHVCTGHGPLGAYYPVSTWTAPNPHGVLKEGDTPSWFFFLLNGLGSPDHPEWGGWGGRFELNEKGVYRDARDQIGDEEHVRVTVWRWRPAFQNEFQARMDWSVAARFEEANHSPVAVCQGDRSQTVLLCSVDIGTEIRLKATGSNDPDDDQLQYRWYIYPEAGTYRGKVILQDATRSQASVRMPRDAVDQTIHVILEVTDNGSPPLTAFRRIVLTGVE